MYIEELYDEEKISSYLVVSHNALSDLTCGNDWYN